MMTNIKNISYYFLAFSFIVVGAMACSDDFLNAPPQGALDATTLANEAGVDAAVISAYSMLDGWSDLSWGAVSSPWPSSGSNWIWGSVLSDDAHKGSEAGDQGQSEELELFQWAPGNTYFNDKFITVYEGISRTNAARNLLASVTDLDAGKVTRLDAETKFLRAHYHFDAWKIWKNVPYITEDMTEFRVPNTADIFPMIVSDLQAAVAGLPETQGEVGRATKGAANAYLGKAYLYNHQYSEAKAALDAVVNSGVYALSSCFHDIFSVDQENSAEMVFSVQASVNDGTSEGQNGMFGDRLNYPHGGSPFGCCGFHQPTQNLVNAHKVDANGLPMANWNAADVVDGDNLDPRLDWTVGRDGIPYLDHGTHDGSWIRAASFSGPFSPKKFAYASGQNQQSGGWTSTQLSPINFPIIRYSDVLLMLAEAEVELGNLERARELTNMVRGRAAACAQGADGSVTSGITSGDGAAYANYSVGTYTTAWTDAGAARDAVRYERRIELALEGHRFFDLRRWGIAETVINTYVNEEKGKRPYLNGHIGYSSKNDVCPIPTPQIELSKIDGVAQFQQNTGY